MNRLTIYYDSHCPLCMAEMLQLKNHDTHSQITFADLHAGNFSEKYAHIDKNRAYKILHVERQSGEILLGLDASCEVWTTVGKHRWLKLLRIPIMKQVSDIFYRLFARFRGPISLLLTGKQQCESCEINSPIDSRERPL